ncbi:MAG: class B sortase [Clostridiales bacterium]|nr:class B sortase [Clostridiales bacterium]
MLFISISAALYLGAKGVAELLERKRGSDYYGALAAAQRVPGHRATPTASPAAPTASQAVSTPAPQAAPTASQAASTASQAASTASQAASTTASQATSTTASQAASTTASQAATAATQAAPTASQAASTAASQATPTAPQATPVERQDGARPAVSAIDFDALRAAAPDVVGWIYIEGTNIDYPLVQGADNSYYLTHLPNGAQNIAGSIMMDAACDRAFGNDVTILHGHHMRSGEMFGDLDEYRREPYYRAHPAMRLYTPAGDRDVAIVAACGVDGRTFGYPTVFADGAAFYAFVGRLAADSAFQAPALPAYGDRLLLLSTCAYGYEDERFVVLGKILDAPAE